MPTNPSLILPFSIVQSILLSICRLLDPKCIMNCFNDDEILQTTATHFADLAGMTESGMSFS